MTVLVLNRQIEDGAGWFDGKETIRYLDNASLGPLMHNIPNILIPLMIFLLGFMIFFNGFKRLQTKKLLENTPMSTVRGLAMGLVKLTGKAVKTRPLRSPFNQIGCAFYRYTIERFDRNNWEVVVKGDSTYCPFWLDDGTGKLMVFPRGAELLMPVDYEYETQLGEPLPYNLINFLKRNDLKYTGLFGRYHLRFKEWIVDPDKTVYVIGTAMKANGSNNIHKAALIQRLEEIKHDPGRMRIAGVNHDGDISGEEWDNVVKNVEQGLLDEELQSIPQDCPTDVSIGQEAGQPFIISDESQIQLFTGLSRKVLLNVFGGATLTLVMLMYLLIILSS